MLAEEFSETVATYLEQYAVDLDLARVMGVHSDGDTIVYPYTSPRGDAYERRHDLRADPDGRSVQARGLERPLLWWPAGRLGAKGRPGPGDTVLLTEDEPNALAALSACGGIDEAVAAVPYTSVPTERVTAELARAEAVILALNSDAAARECAGRFAWDLHHFTTVRVIEDWGEDLASRLAPVQNRCAWLRGAIAAARVVFT